MYLRNTSNGVKELIEKVNELDNEKEYTKLIDGYRDTITSQSDVSHNLIIRGSSNTVLSFPNLLTYVGVLFLYPYFVDIFYAK